MKNINRIMAFVISAAVTAGTVMSRPYNTVSARTVEEIQQEREANSQKIADLEVKLSSLEQSKASEQQYQNMLSQQLEAISENIALLTAEIQQLSDNISSAQDKIAQIDVQIEQQEKDIAAKVETFKMRLSEMYVSSTDNFATVLIGSSSFYDMISRVEMLNRVAEHDQQLIDDILGEINSMEQLKSDLARQKAQLQESIRMQEESAAEKNAEVQMLGEKIASSQQQIASLDREELMLSINRDELAAENKRLDAESEDAHRKNALEAQRLYEEEMRRKGRTVTSVSASAPVVTEITVPAATEAQTVIRTTAERVTSEKVTYATEPTARPTQAPTAQPTTTTTAAATVPPTTAAPVVTAPPVDDSSDWTWPVPGFTNITSPFGYRAEFDEFHRGIDISSDGIYGQPVVAARSGIVDIAAGGCTHDYPKTNGVKTCLCNGKFGNYVQITHDSSTYSRHGHMREIVVRSGQYVNKGDVIGYVGCTGWSTGTHLHFDVNVNGQWVDPLNYVK